MHLVVIERDNAVSGFNAGLLGRIALHHFCHGRQIKAHRRNDRHRQYVGKNKIEQRSRKDDRDPLPDILIVERPLIVAVFIFPFHHAGSAKRQQMQRIGRLAPRHAKDPRSQAQLEFVDLDITGARDKKMSQLMENNDKAEYQYGYDNSHKIYLL